MAALDDFDEQEVQALAWKYAAGAEAKDKTAKVTIHAGRIDDPESTDTANYFVRKPGIVGAGLTADGENVMLDVYHLGGIRDKEDWIGEIGPRHMKCPTFGKK